MIAIALSKEQALDADPRAIQQVNVTANLDRAGNTTMFFIIEEAKETVRPFTRNCKGFVNSTPLSTDLLNNLIFISIKWHNTPI